MSNIRFQTRPLLKISLTSVVTTDGIDLAGVVVEPKGRKQTALIWLHGLTSSFDNGQALISELSRACVKQKIGYFKFNTRGHHVADYGELNMRHLVGAGFERFTDCLKDIDAMVAFVRNCGYTRIVLAGHSTGANKALYYFYRRKTRTVKALLLAGPVSDVVSESKRIGRRMLNQRVTRALVLAQRKTDTLVPASWGFMSAQRYVSLFKPGQAEDVFPWHSQSAKWKELASVRCPVAIVFGERDEALDRDASSAVEIFRQHAKRTRQFTGLVVPGASHGFYHHEREVTRIIAKWLRGVV